MQEVTRVSGSIPPKKSMCQPACKLEVLLVEDNPGDVRLVREALKEGRFPGHLNVATDGDEASDILWKRGAHKDDPRPDLIMLDLNLPGKNGRTILKEIKADPDLRRIPVAVFSSSTAQSDLDIAYALHANCYIRKPTDLDEYMKVVRSIERFWTTVATLPRPIASDGASAS
jgi:chemotaxis family two-component system response regulator Rcp1